MTLEFDRIQALLFDIDGTLSDTDDHMVSRLVRLLKPFNFLFKGKDPYSFARWLVMTAESPANLLYSLPDRLGLDVHLARLFDWTAKRQLTRKHPSDLFMLVEGVGEMLDSLHGHYPMAVVSARNEATTRLFLQHFDLDRYFEVVVTSQTCKHTKPFPDPILYAAQQLGITPSGCLMIGDTNVDVLAALAAGAQSLSVLCGLGREKELRRAGTQLILQSTAEVGELLLKKGLQNN